MKDHDLVLKQPWYTMIGDLGIPKDLLATPDIDHGRPLRYPAKKQFLAGEQIMPWIPKDKKG